MGEEFYCILKLSSGEELFSIVSIDENDGDPLIVLQNPVILKYIAKSGGSMLKIEPWIKFSSENFFIIKSDKVITMTEVKDKYMIDFYNEYLEESESNNKPRFPNPNDSHKVEITEDMGYVSSVEEARKKLEDIFKNLKDS